MSVQLTSAQELAWEYPAKPEYGIEEHRRSIARSIHEENGKVVLVAGPCSVHDTEATLEYAGRLSELAWVIESRAVVVMRVYVEKSRTVRGWKGFLYDPDLDGSCNLGRGIMESRKLMARIAAMGLPVGMEIVNPLAYPYLGDLVSWGCIGARTAESQVHREFVSSLDIPVGFKNATSGNPQTAINSMESAAGEHVFLTARPDGVSAAKSKGNPNTHIILRGGDSGPNYHLRDMGISGNKIMVDCSHGNCEQDYIQQIDIFSECLKESSILGVMLESFLVEGQGSRFGQSITDPCLGWADTRDLILKFFSF